MSLGKLAPHARWRSFCCALRGVGLMLRTQPNAWIMAATAPCVIVAGVWFRLTGIEWCLAATAILLVFLAETFNTAIESLTDLVAPGLHSLAGNAKDLAAGAVLLAALLAFVIGLVIFGPKILRLL